MNIDILNINNSTYKEITSICLLLLILDFIVSFKGTRSNGRYWVKDDDDDDDGNCNNKNNLRSAFLLSLWNLSKCISRPHNEQKQDSVVILFITINNIKEMARIKHTKQSMNDLRNPIDSMSEYFDVIKEMWEFFYFL